jgi:transcriptional regulator with XRE-family HTH domain
MFINKCTDGRNNICGVTVERLRKAEGISQRELADRLQRNGLDVDKNAVQRIESGQRFVTDIQLLYLSNTLNVNLNELLSLK